MVLYTAHKTTTTKQQEWMDNFRQENVCVWN